MTILLFHIISARPSKQPRMVRAFLKDIYGAWLLFFVSTRTNKRYHHHMGSYQTVTGQTTCLSGITYNSPADLRVVLQVIQDLDDSVTPG